jgi:hypothetical protein
LQRGHWYRIVQYSTVQYSTVPNGSLQSRTLKNRAFFSKLNFTSKYYGKKGKIDAENSNLFAGIDGFVNENQPESGIRKDTGSTKRIVNRMGSEDLVERRIKLVQRIQRRCQWGQEGSLERLKTMNKPTKTGESRCLENSPRNNCRC